MVIPLALSSLEFSMSTKYLDATKDENLAHGSRGLKTDQSNSSPSRFDFILHPCLIRANPWARFRSRHAPIFERVLSRSSRIEIAAFARLSGLDRLPPASAGGPVPAFDS
jgi:hypothetical protein